MEVLIDYYDERMCSGVDCAWCLDTSCTLSRTKYEEEEKSDDLV